VARLPNVSKYCTVCRSAASTAISARQPGKATRLLRAGQAYTHRVLGAVADRLLARLRSDLDVPLPCSHDY
jgi:hypothetical protein